MDQTFLYRFLMIKSFVSVFANVFEKIYLPLR